MRYKIILLSVQFFFLIITLSFSQTKMDSLHSLLQTAEGNEKGEILYQLGKTYQLTGEFAKAIESYKNAIKILPDDKTKSNAMYKTGGIYMYFMDYDKAIEYTLGGFEIRELMNDSAGIIAGYNNIANIYNSKGQLNEAKNYYKKALQFAVKTKNTKTQAIVLLNLAGLNSDLENFDIAIKQATESFDLNQELKNYSNMVAALINKGMASYYKENYINSLETYNQAYEICEENNLKYYSGLVLRNMALTCLAMKYYSQAEQYAGQSLEISEELDIPAMRIELFRILSDIYKESKDFEKSLEYFTIHFEYNDSISSAENINKYNELLAMHGIEQKENEILKLTAGQERDKAKLKQQKIILLFMSIILFLSLITLIIFVVLRKRLIFSKDNLVKRNLELMQYESQCKESEKKLKESKIELETIIEQLGQNKQGSVNALKKIYEKAKIPEDKIETLAGKIIDLMENEKIFKQNDISKMKLADKLDTNTKYISIAINQKFNCNFNTYINKYRIKESRQLLATTDMRRVTIEAIGRQAGFNTTNTFNKVFKDEFGITPSYFLKSVKKNNN